MLRAFAATRWFGFVLLPAVMIAVCPAQEEVPGGDVLPPPYIGEGGVGEAVSDTLSQPGAEGEDVQQQDVLVKEGTIVIDAYCGQLLHYNVEWKNVPWQEAQRSFYDDGTHGDEIAYDGIPSKITVIDDRYIGPETWRNKRRLELWAQVMSYPERQLEKLNSDVEAQMLRDNEDRLTILMTERQFRNYWQNEDTGRMFPLSPLLFYSDNAAALDPESSVAHLEDQKWRLDGFISIVREFLLQYEGYEYYPDYTVRNPELLPPELTDKDLQQALKKSEEGIFNDRYWQNIKEGQEMMQRR